MNYIYASRSGNVEELVRSLELNAWKITDGTESVNEPFILFTYTDGHGQVPPVVSSFLERNHGYLKGVIVSGNMQRHGDTFCEAGTIISKKYGVPVIAQVDCQGGAKPQLPLQLSLFVNRFIPCFHRVSPFSYSAFVAVTFLLSGVAFIKL